MNNLNDVRCYRCKAQPGQPCRTPKGDEATEPHTARVDLFWKRYSKEHEDGIHAYGGRVK